MTKVMHYSLLNVYDFDEELTIGGVHFKNVQTSLSLELLSVFIDVSRSSQREHDSFGEYSENGKRYFGMKNKERGSTLLTNILVMHNPHQHGFDIINLGLRAGDQTFRL